jgi:hypothetical protein
MIRAKNWITLVGVLALGLGLGIATDLAAQVAIYHPHSLAA